MVNKDVFSIPQAARFCAMSRGSIWKYVKSGELKASLTPGGQYRILKKDLEFFVREKGMYPLASYQPVGKKILIVDDDIHMQDLLTEMLSREEYETETASSGFEAGTKVVKFKPGLIILDLIMPGMGGRRCLEELLKIDPQAKIVIASGYSVNGPTREALEAGARGFISKPYEVRKMLKVVREVLDME